MIAKTSCQHCGIHIEFEAETTEENVLCPSCGQQTRLFLPSSKPAKPIPNPDTNPQPTQPPAPEYKLPPIESSGIAFWLYVLAVLAGIGGLVGGLLLGGSGPGSDNFGMVVVFEAFASGGVICLVLLGFASLVDHATKSSQRLHRIEILMQKNGKLL